MTVANTGNVSQSYDGDRRASYLVIDGESITIRRVEYDVESEVEELLHSGLPTLTGCPEFSSPESTVLLRTVGGDNPCYRLSEND